MLVERSSVARMECDHGHRDRISLVLEKQRQVVRFDIPQLDLCLHASALHLVNVNASNRKLNQEIRKAGKNLAIRLFFLSSCFLDQSFRASASVLEVSFAFERLRVFGAAAAFA
jgi:hypothetical protein